VVPAAVTGGAVRRFGWFSLTPRVLIVNVLVIALFGAGVLYLDRYERGLIETELAGLEVQGGIFAAALGEGAVLQDIGEGSELVPSLARGMMRRLVEPTHIRARLFLPNGDMVADSRALAGPSAVIEAVELPPPGTEVDPEPVVSRLLGRLAHLLEAREHRPFYEEKSPEHAADYDEVMKSLDGNVADEVRVIPGQGELMLSVAVPVRRYKRVLGAVLLSVGSAELQRKVDQVRLDILRLMLIGFGVSVISSVYLAQTIAWPVQRLAQAAYAIRHGAGRKVEIPDFSRRRDEIGELSRALTAMTQALWQRMDAIERFAADVAHEIKNPLSSLRSAVETAAKVHDPERQQRLMGIIIDDVQRLDRLITDISDASRLDAEMSRLEREPVAIAAILSALVEVQAATREGEGPRIEVTILPPGDPLLVQGKEGRLVQVFQNRLQNALSFSPPQGRIILLGRRTAERVIVDIADQGPGIPEGKLAAIFERFYSERPAGEKFGTHSGLGLAISRQIVEAHGGSIRAENLRAPEGTVEGARFTIDLPGAPWNR
jgi:two-component system sensor histidine kinase ChvG